MCVGLARAIESKYNVSATAIRYLYRRNRKGITAKLDDDLLKYYCNEDTFLMQVSIFVNKMRKCRVQSERHHRQAG
jgi:transcription factor CP2-like protein